LKNSKRYGLGDVFETDVAIIGAGPAGSTAAREIAEAGYDVALIERDDYPGKTNVCGGAILEKYVNALNLPQDIIEKKVTNWICHLFKKSYVLYQPAFSVQRERFDRCLAEVAHQKGANLMVSMIARDVNLSKDKVTVSVIDKANQEHLSMQAKLVIFTDGPNTLSRRKFNLGFEMKPDKTAIACTYEVDWKQNPLDSFEMFSGSEIAPWGYGWIAPKKDLLNVGICCLKSTMRTNIRNYLNHFINNDPKVNSLLKTRRKTKFSVGLIPLAPAKRIVGPRTLVAGDAAGMTEPISGGGIGYAIKGASLAAKIALRALRENRFDQSFLTAFDIEWRRCECHKNILKQYLITKFFMKYLRFDTNAYSRLIRVLLWRSGAKELT